MTQVTMPQIVEFFRKKNLREIDSAIDDPILPGPALPEIGDGLSPKENERL